MKVIFWNIYGLESIKYKGFHGNMDEFDEKFGSDKILLGTFLIKNRRFKFENW